MKPQTIAWIVAGLLAVTTLSRLMQARQQRLKELLQTYLQAQREWSRKRAQAARLAHKVASAKVAEEAAVAPPQEGAVGSLERSRQQKAA